MDARALDAGTSPQVRQFLDRLTARSPGVPPADLRVELGDVVVRDECFTADVIVQAVAAAFGGTATTLRDRSSRPFPRFVAMYLLHEFGRLSYPEIAAQLGMKNHTSVRYGAIEIAVRMAGDADLTEVLADLMDAVRAGRSPRRVLLVRDEGARRFSGTQYTRVPSDEGGENLVQRTFIAVADVFDVALEEILGRSRESRVMAPRHVAIYLLWKLAGWSTPRIGEHVNRDHSTVLYACERVRGRVACEPAFARKVARVEELIRATDPVLVSLEVDVA